MKRFWLVMLSLGLVLAFSASAMAVDVKFSGSFYAAGMYQDKTTFMKDTASDGPSTAFYYQRLRVQTDFVVSPGLSLVTRFDALERAWGAARTAGGTSSDQFSAGTVAENENIAFDWAYIQYVSPIGVFMVGYMNDGAWGTVFGDNSSPLGKIQYVSQFGPVTALAYIGKFQDNSVTAKNPAGTRADADIDQYVAAVTYNFKQGAVGLLGKYLRVAATKNATASSFVGNMYFLDPFVKATIGPVTIQAELIYGFGKYMKFDDLSGSDIDLNQLAGWIDATADFGMFYAGGTFAYVQGDDPSTADKKEGGPINGGADWNPTLVMFNYDRTYWAGSIPGYGGTQMNNTIAQGGTYLTSNNQGMTNAWFAQGRVGVRPIAKLDIMGSVSWAQADKKPGTGAAAIVNSTYGWEVDLTGTYKITNNLSYMLGIGYLFTGDYFKGNAATAGVSNVKDEYLVLNKLTLTF